MSLQKAGWDTKQHIPQNPGFLKPSSIIFFIIFRILTDNTYSFIVNLYETVQTLHKSPHHQFYCNFNSFTEFTNLNYNLARHLANIFSQTL